MLINSVKQIIPPRKALNTAFLKLKPYRDDMERFKTHLIKMLDSLNPSESEEYHKNLIISFLKSTYYQGKFSINTKGRNDLVIHNGKLPSSKVGVIIEAKRPTNSNEMASVTELDCKAMQELVLYYLRERFDENNLELKHLIITNLNEWFIFDATEFEKYFAENKNLVSNFIKFQDGLLSGRNTDFFYKSVASPEIIKVKDKINFTHFNIDDYKTPLFNESKTDDKKLISLYKLLSPEHLLKLPFANDSNSLDKQFYGELLHIIGLNEVKKSGKKLIQRAKKSDRNYGTLLENTITQVESLDKLRRFKNRADYGSDNQEQLFNVGLELCITWINRILFLKLLEAQLLTYHKNNPDYEFLNFKKLKDYDDLNKLFFRVLAKKSNDRNPEIQKLFSLVPFLNSSLFEPSEIEQDLIFINNLDNDCTIPYYKSTVLKDSKGRKRKGKFNAIEYLFDFLSAYDFSSEGAEEIQEENKTLINASVLGLIFEKINGYKDGSFFTPGFITMYMCKETIKKAVLQKFRDVKGWDFSDFNALYNKVSGFNETNDILEANDIINSITICDPAVGSGHFLVSALNEILSIKSELGILCDSTGRKLNNHKVNVENDELVVTNSQNQLFEYIPNNDESQRIQETLFKEKQTIIENCLFGVDINPNSVKICRLRLWIELLKNAYYRPDGELETLPNIDINIKCGNSLISRFSLDSDLKKALKNTRHTIVAYQAAINTYSHAKDKQEKNEMRDLINEIKNSFKNEIKKDHQVYKDLDKFEGQLVKLTKQVDVFGFNKKQEDEFNKKVAAKVSEIETQKKKIKHLENNKIYNNAFEWRFEFPEVLSDDGEFIGFDVVLANPPYMRIQEIKASQPAEKIYYETKYENAEAAYDLANIFFELAVNISSSNCKNAFIFPHKFFNTSAASGFRSYLRKGQYIDKISHFGANMIFEDAITYTCVAQFSKSQSKGFYFQRFPFKSDFKSLMLDEKKYTYISYHMIEKASELYGKNQWILFDNKEGYRLFEKIYNQRSNISSKFEKISQGIATAKDEIYLFRGEKNENYIKGNFINDEVGREIEEGIMRPYLKGKEVQRYSSPLKNLYILFPYNLSESGKANIMEESEIRQNYPNAYQWLKKTEKEHRKKDNKSTNDEFWYRYARNQGVDKIERTKLSSMEICVTHPNVILDNDNFYHPTTVYSWYLNENAQESYEYYLAIANSKLLWWFLIITGDTLQGDARRFKTNYLNPFPLPETVSQEIQSEIENKVNEVITLKKHNSKINTENIERQIDYIIYDIYGLTKDEIKVVEEV